MLLYAGGAVLYFFPVIPFYYAMVFFFSSFLLYEHYKSPVLQLRAGIDINARSRTFRVSRRRKLQRIIHLYVSMLSPPKSAGRTSRRKNSGYVYSTRYIHACALVSLGLRALCDIDLFFYLSVARAHSLDGYIRTCTHVLP